MKRNQSIKVRLSGSEKDLAKRVSEVSGKDIATIFRQAIANMAKRHGVKEVAE